MPETQRTTEQNRQLERILAPYDSCEDMTPGQLKEIGSLLFALVPADMTKGFAQKLIDGQLHKLVETMIAQERRSWRLLHSRMEEVKQFVVPKTPAKSLLEIMGGLVHVTEAGNRFWYRGLSGRYSTWDQNYEARNSIVAMCNRTTGKVDFDRLLEALGGKFSALNPLQALSILDWKTTMLKEEWKDTIFSFFLGRTHDGKALFLQATRGIVDNQDCQELNEWFLEKGDSIAPNQYLVFSRSLFQ